MDTNLYGFVLEKLRTTRLTRQEIADGSGVPCSTVTKIGAQITTNPTIRSIEALANFFLSAKPSAMGDVTVYPSAPPAAPATPDKEAAVCP
jgi:hypothetical protein